jgi:hypothetical protein
MMEAIRSSETPVLSRATRRKIPEDGVLHNCMQFVESQQTLLRSISPPAFRIDE